MLLGQENSRDIFIELVLKQQYKTFLSWCDSIESAIHVNIQMTSDPNTQVQIQTQNYHNFVHVVAMLKHAKKLSKFISFPISTFRYPISILKDKKCNHNNTLAPFCYLIGSGSWFNKFKYYSSWFFGIETFLNLILRSLKPYLNTLTSFLHQSVQDQGIRNIADIIFYDRTVFLFSEAKLISVFIRLCALFNWDATWNFITWYCCWNIPET